LIMTARFHNIHYTNGYKYQLYADCDFKLPAQFARYGFVSKFMQLQNGVLTIRAGYAWDGASGPTVDTKNSMRGGLVHDALYQAMREGLLPRELKPDADQLLYETCIADGMLKARAWLWKRAVLRFGLSATIQNKDILVAP
jgi:hypothetical protein